MHHPYFVQFLTFFNGNKDYFECHEVLEDYWKEVAPRDRKHPLTGWIQLATGMYHWRRENYKGATTILKKGYATLQLSNDSSFVQNLDYYDVMTNYEHAILCAEKALPFQAFDLKIIDVELKDAVSKEIQGLDRVEPSFLLHKHLLRDRSEVIASREAALLKRKDADNKRSRH
ncbi:MAG: DUF309 domain-containing protein [Kurthia sp.]